MSNSRRSRWKPAVQTVIRVRINLAQHQAQQYDVDDTMTRNSDRDTAWLQSTPGAQEAEGDIQQLTPTPENNTQGFGEQNQNSNEVT